MFWRPAEDALSDLKLSATIGCDFVARTMREAVIGALSGPVAAKAAPPKLRRPSCGGEDCAGEKDRAAIVVPPRRAPRAQKVSSP